MTSTPNMGLPVPDPGITPSPDWGTEQQAAMSLLDTHDHSADKGVQVPTSGININDDLSSRNYRVIDVKAIQFIAQASEALRRTIYVKGIDLYYRDGSGNEIRITQNGAVNGTGGGGTGGPQTSFSVDSVAELKLLSPILRLTNAAYGTLGYATPYDGGSWDNYQWRPSDLSVSDNCMSIRPVDIASDAVPGRFRYIPSDDTFEARCSDLDFTGQTDVGVHFSALLAAAESFGIGRFLLPAGDLNIGNHASMALENIRIQGAGIGRTRLRGLITSTGQVATVRLITQAALPTCVAAGSGPTKTLTCTINGTLLVDGMLVNVNDRLLITQQTNKVDNGVYVATNPGSAGAKFVLTRAADFSTSTSIAQRIGVRSTDGPLVGVSNLNGLFILSAKDGKLYDNSAMVMDVSPQYWTFEDFIAGGLSLSPQFEIPVFIAGPPLLGTHWNNWTQAGDRVLPNVQMLAGGSWFNPGDGITYPVQAAKPGDKWFLNIGGTPSDQSWYFWGQKAVVEHIDSATGNVTIDRPIPICPPRMFSYPNTAATGMVNLGTIAAVGANQVTLTVIGNAAGILNGQYGWATNRSGVGNVTSGNPGTGVITFSPGTMPAFVIGDTLTVSYPRDVTDLGTISAVGANQITLTTLANAGGLTAGQCITSFQRQGVGIIVSGNPGTGVIVFQAGTMPPFVIGDSCNRSNSFPWFNTNFARHNTDNEWRRIIKDCQNVSISDLTFDGVTLAFNFVTNLHMDNVELANLHAGSFFSGLISPRFHRLKVRNCSGYHQPTFEGISTALNWYGWAFQNNFCIDSEITDCFVDNQTVDVVDQESENETRWQLLNVNLGTPDLPYRTMFIAGSTPFVVRHNPVNNLIVRGAYQATSIVIAEPVVNLTYNVPVSGTGYTGVNCDVNQVTGQLYFNGRKYSMNQRLHWRMRIPLGPTIDVTYVRPYDGLWANTRVWLSSTLGVTAFYVGPALFDLSGFLRVIPPLVWSVPYGDQLGGLGGGYPNATDTDHQSFRVTTDGTSPVGAYMLIESDVVPQVNRGDSYMGVGIGASANRAVPWTDQSLLWEIQGAGSPVGVVTPLYIGQRYFDRVAVLYWESVGIAAANWVRMTV